MAGVVTIIEFGQAFAAAMVTVNEALILAKKLATATGELTALGKKAIIQAKESLEAIFEAYQAPPDTNQNHRYALSTNEKANVTNQFPDDIRAFIDLLLNAGTATTISSQMQQDIDKWTKIVNSDLGELFLHPDEWEKFEIDPPANPAFKPKLLSGVPEGMEIYEVVCPNQVQAMQPEAAKKCKPKAKKRRKTKCSKPAKAKCPKKTTCPDTQDIVPYKPRPPFGYNSYNPYSFNRGFYM